MNLAPHIERSRKRFDELEDAISSPDLYSDPARAQQMLKEHARLKNLLGLHGKLLNLEKNLAENRELVSTNSDAELTALAREELPGIEKLAAEIHRQMLANILPPDPNDSRNIIVELRAGTGGDEAAIFSADLFRMYSRYAEKEGWKIEVLESSPSTMGG